MIFSLFSQSQENYEQNLIKREIYSEAEINEINIHLIYENIQVKKIYGNEIVIEVYSNNDTLLPQINHEKEILKINGSVKKHTKGDFCSMVIYIPQENHCKSVSLLVKDNPVFINDLTIEDLTIQAENSMLEIKNIEVDFLLCETEKGDMKLSLNSTPKAISEIKSKEGNIELKLLENFEGNIIPFTDKGKLIDKRESYMKKEDVSQLFVESIYGNIIIE